MATTAHQVGTSPSKIYVSGDDPTVEVTIQNLGPNPLYINDEDDTATAASGLRIPSGASYVTDGLSPIWAYCATLQVTPNDTRVAVERRASGVG